MMAPRIHGIISDTAVRRTHEIDVRVGVGARTADLLKLVLGQALWLVTIGVMTGLKGERNLMRVVGRLLNGVRPGDPRTLAAVSGLHCGVALAAGCAPARRTTKVDPVEALR